MVFMTQILSQWNNYFPFSSMSSAEFYHRVEEAINKHRYPNIKISRTTHKEKGMFSASREYLRVKYGDLIFGICAAPFGKDFYVSWWLFESEDIFRKLLRGTTVGNYLTERASKLTFYEADIEAIFRSSIHECVLEVIEVITNETGRKLSEYQKQIHVGA